VAEAGKGLVWGVVSSLLCLNDTCRCIEMFPGGHGDIGKLEAWAVCFSFFVYGAQMLESPLPHTLI